MTDEAAFREVVATHGAMLRRIARGYAAEHDEEDDLYQEVLFQVWRSLPRFRGASALSTWLYRVALNTGLTYRRRTRRRRVNDARVGPREEPATAGDPRGPALLLREYLGSLGPVDRSLVMLYLEGLPNPAIGEVLGLSSGAVAVRLHRVKQAFRERYLER